MKDKKYVVADGKAFVGKNKIYCEGDEIDASAFKNEEQIRLFAASGKIKEIPVVAPAANNSDKDKDKKGFDRFTLEKIALENGLFKETTDNRISSLKDSELKKLVKDAGF